MKTVAYLRVSTEYQDIDSQKYAILNFAQKSGWSIDEFISVKASSRRTSKARKMEELMQSIQSGDRVIVSELSRLGRSLIEVIEVINLFIKHKVAFIAIKENLRVEGKQDIHTKVMVTLFGLFAEVERDLISERTREGLNRAKSKGIKLGRPKGALGHSKLDPKKDEISWLLSKDVSQASIAKITDASRTTLSNFIKTRGLDANRPTKVRRKIQLENK